MLESVFDLFMQVDQSLARSLGGLGIGLTMVRSLVSLHGGTVRARSDGLGKGTEIEVRFPLPSQIGEPDASASADPLTPMPNWSLRTLIIEDNPDTLAMMQLVVSSWGHVALGASDGLTGLDVFLAEKPDVALVDIGLPGISGYQLAANIRSSPQGGRAYLVAVTGYGRPEDRSRALDAGFDAYIIKPVNPTELQRLLASRELRATLSRRRS
jgi:CheY-like chemotaxis protein